MGVGVTGRRQVLIGAVGSFRPFPASCFEWFTVSHFMELLYCRAVMVVVKCIPGNTHFTLRCPYCGLVPDGSLHILQNHFIGNDTTMRLPQGGRARETILKNIRTWIIWISLNWWFQRNKQSTQRVHNEVDFPNQTPFITYNRDWTLANYVANIDLRHTCLYLSQCLFILN